MSAAPDDRDGLLTIGSFARRARLSMKALRLYDRLGLLVPASVDPGSGYRRYQDGQLYTARLIGMLRRLDMPLAQIAQVLAVPPPGRADLVQTYWDGVERRVAAQRDVASRLRASLLGMQTDATAMPVDERDVPEQTVLTEQRHVQASELAWIRAACVRLLAVAHRLGGRTGPVLVIYHGAVNEDGDGPVEVCVPIDPGRGPFPEVPVRIEPAHREVFVPVTRDRFDLPQILTAYDTVEAWIDAHRRARTGPPREVYRSDADPRSAAPTEHVCDVAFPIR